MSGELEAEAPQEGGMNLTEKPVASEGAPASKNVKGGADKELAEGHSPETRVLLHKVEIIEGKREKKSIQRLDLQLGKPTEPVKIEEGTGMKLGEIVQVAYNIGRLKAEELKPLHKILFNRPGAAASLKRNIRQFSGFTFEANSEPYKKKREVVKRLTMAGLKTICTILDLETNGTHDVRVDRILTFLLNPKTRERPLPKKRKKPTSSKSKAIVDSSSDDDDGRSDKDRGPAPKSKETIDDKDSTSDEDDIEKVLDSDTKGEDDNTTDKESMRKTPTKQKASAAKKVATKKAGVAKKSSTSRKAIAGKKKTESIKAVSLKQKAKATKVTEEEVSDVSEVSVSDNDSDHLERQKRAKKRPAAKTKKADSSSSKMTSNKDKGSDMEEDTSDDEPLIKLLKKPPTDEQLRETVSRLLKDADLEEVTMKHVYKKVFEFYPEHDLTSRKAFIKETVKNLIS